MGAGSSKSSKSVELSTTNEARGEGSSALKDDFRWTCNNCEADNPVDTFECKTCGLSRGQEASDQFSDGLKNTGHSWKVEAEEEVNDLPTPEADDVINDWSGNASNTLETGERRYERKMSEYKPPTPLPPDQLWMCAVCNFENHLSFDSCRICGAAKTNDLRGAGESRNKSDSGEEKENEEPKKERRGSKHSRSKSRKRSPSPRKRSPKRRSQSSEPAARDSGSRKPRKGKSDSADQPKARSKSNKKTKDRTRNASYLQPTASSKTRKSKTSEKRSKRR